MKLDFLEIFLICISSWGVAQVLKFIGTSIVRKQIKAEVLLETGGMPSSHTALVVSFAVSIYCLFGHNSFPFAISAVFAIVVMHDAFKVRKAVGNNTLTFKHFFEDIIEQNYKKKNEELRVLEEQISGQNSRESNRLLRDIKKKRKEIDDLSQLDTVLGHTFFQVLGGAFLGAVISLTWFFILK